MRANRTSWAGTCLIVYIVRKQLEGYTNQDEDRTKLGREVQATIVNPLEREYKYMASNKILPN